MVASIIPEVVVATLVAEVAPAATTNSREAVGAGTKPTMTLTTAYICA